MTGLIIRREHRAKLKNFREEVRGVQDVDHLLDDAVITISHHGTDLEKIVLETFQMMSTAGMSESFDEAEFQRKMFSNSGNSEDRDLERVFTNSVQFYQTCPDSSDKQVEDKWVIGYCSLDGLSSSHVGFIRLASPCKLNSVLENTQLVIVVVGPTKEKHTKTAEEISKSFATVLSNAEVLDQVLTLNDTCKIKTALFEAALTERAKKVIDVDSDSETSGDGESCCFYPGRGITHDFVRRIKHYVSDYTDGIKDATSIRKTISTAVFLIFTILPTSIAYGMLNDDNTNGKINVQKVIIGQAIGGLFFGLFGGQELLILSTTAPLSIYIQVIYTISETNEMDFYSLYAWVGIWAQLFLIVYAVFDIADLMKFTKRSTEEIFGLFISFALTYKAVEAIVKTYVYNYRNCGAQESPANLDGCDSAVPLIFILLVFGTWWISMTLNNCRRLPFFTHVVRDVVADYALPIAVIIMALISRLMFYNVSKETFNVYKNETDLEWPNLSIFPSSSQWTAIGLAFPLSLLFFMDQLLVTKTVDNKQNKLQKGSAHHWDLFIVAILNIFLSLFGLPWMHGALPSAFLHLKALADVEDRIHNGYVNQIIVKVRETRLSVLISHLLMIPIYFFLIPFLNMFIPTSLFHGLFLFMAFSSLSGNEFWERLLLIFTEQRAYPAAHYLRVVPQKIVHLFTVAEFIQLAILVVIGFYPNHYVKMAFPIVIALFIPLRNLILPLIFKPSHLEAIDGEH